jgi:hypothetical protein
MISISSEQFETILPLAVKWAQAKEKVILEHGTVLSPQYMDDAKSVGVKYPERVRIYEVPQIPIPKHPILRAAAEATQLISPATIGIALRYGIFIHNDFSNDRYIIVHELVHTMQCERFGGFHPLKKNISGNVLKSDIRRPRWSKKRLGLRIGYVG